MTIPTAARTARAGAIDLTGRLVAAPPVFLCASGFAWAVALASTVAAFAAGEQLSTAAFLVLVAAVLTRRALYTGTHASLLLRARLTLGHPALKPERAVVTGWSLVVTLGVVSSLAGLPLTLVEPLRDWLMPLVLFYPFAEAVIISPRELAKLVDDERAVSAQQRTRLRRRVSRVGSLRVAASARRQHRSSTTR